MGIDEKMPFLNNKNLFSIELDNSFYTLYRSSYDDTYFIYSKIEDDGFRFFPCINECYTQFLESGEYIKLTELKKIIACSISIFQQDVDENDIHCDRRNRGFSI